jgi:hypothetical protein
MDLPMQANGGGSPIRSCPALGLVCWKDLPVEEVRTYVGVTPSIGGGG